MSEHNNHGHDAHPEPNYMKVFYWLCGLTTVSFITVSPLWFLGPQTGHTLVMMVAVVKAALVAMFFMHLYYDWNKLYVMIVPSMIMGLFLICALMPDMTFSQTRVTGDGPPPAAMKLGETAQVEVPAHAGH
jgi:caa(3)-type oxidase subunit IV